MFVPKALHLDRHQIGCSSWLLLHRPAGWPPPTTGLVPIYPLRLNWMRHRDFSPTTLYVEEFATIKNTTRAASSLGKVLFTNESNCGQRHSRLCCWGRKIDKLMGYWLPHPHFSYILIYVMLYIVLRVLISVCLKGMDMVIELMSRIRRCKKLHISENRDQLDNAAFNTRRREHWSILGNPN